MAAHKVYSGIAVGGTLVDTSPGMSAQVRGASVIETLPNPPASVRFERGVTTGPGTFAAAVDFEALEAVAYAVDASVQPGGYAVYVVEQGSAAGSYDGSMFCHPDDTADAPQAEDNGRSLVSVAI